MVWRPAIRFFERFAVFGACLVILLVPSPTSQIAQAQNREHLTVLSTTDLHGNLLPVDYYANRPDERGLAKLATLIKQARQKDPNLLLLDSGDVIQGTPLVYLHNVHNGASPDPMMMAMNALGYDAMAVGNHEYNFGLPVLEKARSEAKFPWLSANTYDAGTDHTHFQPYIVKTIKGVRVGVLGLTTPGISQWETLSNYQGLEFHEPVAEAEKWVRILRTKDSVDVVIIAMHMGLEADLENGVINPGQLDGENQAIAIAQKVPGIDVILMGHTHREVPSVYINGVLLTQADKWGRRIAKVDLYLDRTSNGGWSVAAKTANTIPVTESVPVAPEIAALAKPYDDEARKWLDRVIGSSSVGLDAHDCRFRDTAIMDLIQRVQLEAGHGDVSMAACFNTDSKVPKGPVTVRDIAGLYEYENTLVTVEMTGRQVKEALEQSAKYFRAAESGKDPSQLVGDMPGYNFDIAQGVDYVIDLTRPVGDRIVDLRYRGKPLDPAQKLRVVTNNYRANGGGGYSMYRGAPALYRSSQEIRDLIIEWVGRNKEVLVSADNNWSIRY